MSTHRVIFPDPDMWTTSKGTPMTEEPTDYPSEWDDVPPPHPLDPRLSRVLDSIRPTPAEEARVAELVHQYVARDHAFGETFQHFWTDRAADHRWPNVFLALLEAYAVTAIGAQGEGLTIARAEGDLTAAREDIVEFGSYE